MAYDPASRMAHLLGIALSFPVVVYTVLLGVSLVYWIFVVVGAAHVNLLGDGAADGALDGLDGGVDGGLGADGGLDGGVDGALDGAAKGALEGAAKAALDGVKAGAFDADGGGDGHDGAFTGMLASLRLRSAPATVVLSVLVLFSWLFTVFGVQIMRAEGGLFHGALASLADVALLLLAPIASLVPTSFAIRPLARVFAPPKAAANRDLVGKLCTIRTGTVTDRFGEALLDDGGAGIVVRVRVDGESTLKRGDQAVIVGYDPDRQEFTVAPMDGLLDERPVSAPRAREASEAEGEEDDVDPSRARR